MHGVFGYDNVNSGFCSLVTITGSRQCETSQEEHNGIKLGKIGCYILLHHTTF